MYIVSLCFPTNLQAATMAANEQRFTLIQGPPGTGKTKTVCALLNVLNVTRFQLMYQSLVSSY